MIFKKENVNNIWYNIARKNFSSLLSLYGIEGKEYWKTRNELSYGLVMYLFSFLPSDYNFLYFEKFGATEEQVEKILEKELLLIIKERLVANKERALNTDFT